ncbi:MAG: magnesium chelatase ATPase subunit I, partial [Wenzhouxiangellaceae bacterium]
MAFTYPFSALVGQEEMKLALLITVVDSSIGGVLVFGERGTGKSTAVRALANLLPKMRVVTDCRYGCDPAAAALCEYCNKRRKDGALKSRLAPVPVVDLP